MTRIDPNVLAQLTADIAARKARHEARRAGLWAQCLALAQQIEPVSNDLDSLERDCDEPDTLAPSVDVMDSGRRIDWQAVGEDVDRLYPHSSARTMTSWCNRLLAWPERVRRSLDRFDQTAE